MKYYGTNTNGFTIPDEIRKKYDLMSTHHQYRLVIKAKSRAAANRRWKEITGYGRDIFYPDFTSETGNKVETEGCDDYGEIISSLNGIRTYTDLKVIVDEIKTHRESIIK